MHEPLHESHDWHFGIAVSHVCFVIATHGSSVVLRGGFCFFVVVVVVVVVVVGVVVVVVVVVVGVVVLVLLGLTKQFLDLLKKI